MEVVAGPTHPEDIRCCAFVGGLERHEGDAVVQRRVAQHAGPEDGVFRDVARRVDAGENVRETLLHRFGVPVPHQLLRAGLLHGSADTGRGEARDVRRAWMCVGVCVCVCLSW